MWGKRVLTNDIYELEIYGEDIYGDPNPFWSVVLGYVNSYVLNALPPGFSFGVGYFWDMYVYGPDGYGWSYSTNDIQFLYSALLPNPFASPGGAGWRWGSEDRPQRAEGR
jgi:hypothetical protein